MITIPIKIKVHVAQRNLSCQFLFMIRFLDHFPHNNSPSNLKLPKNFKLILYHADGKESQFCWWVSCFSLFFVVVVVVVHTHVMSSCTTLCADVSIYTTFMARTVVCIGREIITNTHTQTNTREWVINAHLLLCTTLNFLVVFHNLRVICCIV